MRTQCIILVLGVFLMCPFVSAQWVRQESGTSQNLYGVSFVDANTGTVVGDSGTILRTTNGGATWTSQSAPTKLRLTEMQFIDANLGWVVGDSGIIIHTTNGGESWGGQNSGTTNNLLGVSFTDAMTGCVVGGETILHTTNSGENWTSLNTNTGVYLRSVFFVNRDTGFAVGDTLDYYSSTSGRILRTTNGGMSWVRVAIGGSSSNSQTAGLGSAKSPPPVHQEFRRVQFTDDLTGCILGHTWVVMLGYLSAFSSYFLNTTNAGATWSKPAVSFGGTDLTSSHFANSSTGWAVGTIGVYDDTTTIWYTTDGGSTWNIQFVEPYGPRLEDIYLVDNTNGWAVGESGTILHTTNGGVTSVGGEHQHGVPQQYLLSQNYPNPFNLSTTIRYTLPKPSDVRLSVHDMLGREVFVLVNERKNAGSYEERFNATGLSGGVYFYRLSVSPTARRDLVPTDSQDGQAGDFTQTKRLLLLK